MYKTIKEDERYCLLCNQRLDTEIVIDDFWEEKEICLECEKKLKGQKRIYEKDGKRYIVFHEYDDYLERLLFRYKEQRDIALAPIFLSSYKKELIKMRKKYAFVVLCSSEEKRKFRAFEPLIEWFKAIGIEVYSPLYKSMDWKQSNLSFEKRKGIKNVLKKKEHYTLPNKPLLLFDDVVTSGASLETALELLDIKTVIVFSAHKSWLESMKRYQKSCEKM